jgi:hypothetical protein
MASTQEKAFCVIQYAVTNSATSVQRELFLCGYVKDTAFAPPLSTDIPDLKSRITEVAVPVARGMLVKVSEVAEYQIEVCRVNRGLHIRYP